MKYSEITSHYDGAPASLALLSTYKFDPVFFERRLLRTAALARARRIAVFMDYSQWVALMQDDFEARHLNRRYILVPVKPASAGVFHPKLNLLIYQSSAAIHCGSNNLTRSGTFNNLELLNVVRWDLAGEENATGLSVACAAYDFFVRSCSIAEQQAGKIVTQWLSEERSAAPWLNAKAKPSGIELLDTLAGPLWEQWLSRIESPPKRIVVLSPFHDRDGRLLDRVRQKWPGCRIRLVVQPCVTSLAQQVLRRHKKALDLQAIPGSRRVHAKLVAWGTDKRMSAIAGSANFTAAAFDGANVEACLYIPDATDIVAGLFKDELAPERIEIEAFEPGNEDEPVPGITDTNLLITSAVLRGHLIEVRLSKAVPLKKVKLALRAASESRPRVVFTPPSHAMTAWTLEVEPRLLSDAGALLVNLVAEEADGRRTEGPVTWVIDEQHLTHEVGTSGGASRERHMEETGEGLPEYLEELGKREGLPAVIEFLRRFNLRFVSGEDDQIGGPPFRFHPKDPFWPDTPPEWIIHQHDAEDMKQALWNFAERHEAKLRRHAAKGNLNAMENFLIIAVTVLHTLYSWHLRGLQANKDFVPKPVMVHWACRYLQLATAGFSTEEDESPGYLSEVLANLNDDELLSQHGKELNFGGHCIAILRLAQFVRAEGTAEKPASLLPTMASETLHALGEAGLRPDKAEMRAGLQRFYALTEPEIGKLAR